MTYAQTKQVDWETYAADLYDTLLVLAPYQQYIRDVVDQLPDCEQARILDAGCGTGNLTELIAAKKPKELWAVDASEAMLTAAAQKCDATVHTKYVDLQNKLPFGDSQFDHIVCGNVLYAVKNPHEMLCELRRALKPRGTLVLATPKLGYENGFILKDHCQDTGPDEDWTDFHASPERERMLIRKTFDNDDLCERFQELAKHNNIIQGSSHTTLFTKASLQSALMQAGFVVKFITTTYAEQNLLAVCTKGF